MFERYTQSARRVIFHAREEASGSPLSKVSICYWACSARMRPSLPDFGGTMDAVADFQQKIQSIRTVGQPVTGPVEVPLSADSKRILIFAAEEAGPWTIKRFVLGTFY